MSHLTEKEKKWSDQTLENKVFIYNSSEADKRFFKQKIQDFLSQVHGYSFSQYMFKAIWERNAGGTTGKYTYFNERAQRIFIDKYFYEWMVRMINKIEAELKQLKEFTNGQ